MINSDIKIVNGVYIGSDINFSFSDAYLSVREKENRLYSDEVVKKLPLLNKKNAHHKEWKLRQKSTKRFINYLKNNPKKNILEIGCGNGWFTNLCANHAENTIGVDINLLELEQASKLFSNNQLQFVYWDIFTKNPFNEKFDLVVLNAVVQYFPHFDRLVTRLIEILKSNGEIHIIDSPFYKEEEIKLAKLRTKEYYKLMEVPEMSSNYYHHSNQNLSSFDIFYLPEISRWKKILKGKDMPFGWYCMSV